MAGGGEGHGAGSAEEKGCSFEWDEESKLYFHASSGFYHDPDAGWYYSSRDGLYYAFENGNYVLLESNNKCDELEGCHSARLLSSKPSQMTSEEPCNIEYVNCDGAGDHLQPPSEWLEETLINLYLMGHSNSERNGDGTLETLEPNGEGNKDVYESQTHESTLQEFLPCHMSVESNNVEEIGQGLAPDVVPQVPDPGVEVVPADDSWNEEIWQAQYGQVAHSEEASAANFPVIDLWDWLMVPEKGHIGEAKLVGRLVRRSTKAHQSLPSSGNLKRTAAIREVHLDLVRVASGKVYRLRIPNGGYLATLQKYDASNPTKDWAFPDLFADKGSLLPSSSEKNASEMSDNLLSGGSPANFCHVSSKTSKANCPKYRDRAAQRRALHGGFGIGPGQKSLHDNCKDEDAGTFSEVEAVNMSFGPGSYARRLLEGMGWKEGDTLGKTNQGLTEPLQAIGNKGNAGVGWNGTREN